MAKRKWVSEIDIIRQRDKMPIQELIDQTRSIYNKKGRVDFRLIFEDMGYTHGFNDKWYILEDQNKNTNEEVRQN